ncbi:Coatomer subunit beta' [Grifola frondosa]|uniref:Coatomer subunit beta' n=1 Tax=Grifola frondosa TaxID=5627 RepID=A0A1C7M5N8_GRIFR|nr:Coatomer subunit beta' [Grifola frondosa]
MLLDVNRKLFTRSDRVKGVDFHPTEPWILTGLYNGTVNIYNHETGALIKTFEVAEVPVRCVRFIPRKNWFVAGSDDFQLRVFNYNTHEKVAAFEAHPDYIRCLTVHPTASIVLTGSDDMTIKAWDWDKQWRCIQTYEGHTHYIMNIAVNPKDPNTFASSCLDRSVKMWSLGSSTANFTMEAHDKGVNYVEFYPGADKPYLVTASDDKTVKVWDYLSKSCVQTLEGHTNNVLFAVFHPNIPIIISGGEDGTVKLWNSGTYRLENTLSYALERAWCIALRKVSNEVAIGYDEGLVVIKLGRDEPTFSMDPSGKLIYTRNNEVLSANLQTIQDEALADGNRIPLSIKELGTTEIFATSLNHSPNGRFVTVVGDGEYIVYTALAWRNKAFGNGNSFAWAGDSNTYAVLEGRMKIRVYKNFRERGGAGMKGAGSWSIDGIHGGTLLGAQGLALLSFGTGKAVISCGESKLTQRMSSGPAQGVLSQLLQKLEEGVEVSDEANRLNYFVGNESYTITPFDTPLFLLGYIPAHNRVYLADKDVNVYSYSLSLSLVEYQTAVLRGDMDAAAEILPTVPKEQRNKIATFLEGRGLKELALEVTTDPDQKFDLSLQLDDLDSAVEIARSVPELEAETKWKAIGDRALTVWRFDLARESYEKAGDLSALMLLLLAIGDRDGLTKLASTAEEKGQNNLAFASLLQLGDPNACVDLLVKTHRAPEAATFARTYAPSKVSEAVTAWRADLQAKKRPKLASVIADPSDHPELFEEGWEEALRRERGQPPQPVVNGTSDAPASEIVDDTVDTV